MKFLAVVLVSLGSLTVLGSDDFTPRDARLVRPNAKAAIVGQTSAETVENYLGKMGTRLKSEDKSNARFTHLRMTQEVEGLTVYGAYVKASLDKQGRLVGIIENLVQPGAVTKAKISVEDALDAALSHHYGDVAALKKVSTAGDRTMFARDNFFFQNPSVTKVVIPTSAGLSEAFLIETWETESNKLYHTLVSRNGKVLFVENRTSTDSYNIYPDHPGNSNQTVVNGPGTGNAESPNGWVFSNTTTGNNVDAYLDRDANNAPDTGSRPVSATADFLASADLSIEPTQGNNQDVAVQNLFYWNNVIHDTLYRHGFTEAAGNFQENNFGLGGQGSDSVLAEAQDGGGTNNANFATPSDGSNPRMQMFLWTQTNPGRDGDLDSDIIWHEYGHGLTWRMIGSMSGPMSGAIGEGMSDVLAILQNNNDVVGEYSYNNSNGIRRAPYTNYPFTYGDFSGNSVHSDGEVYAASIWLLWQLFQDNGLSLDLLMDYLVQGMNFTPAGPTMEQMRDGILAAASSSHHCLIWEAFANYGIGEGAVATRRGGGPFANYNVTESFTVPSSCSGSTGNNAPTASFTYTTTDLTANFDGSGSSDSDGSIVSYAWDFGDGATGSGQTASHTYGSNGTYTVTLTVTDDDGATDSTNQSVSVSTSTGGGISLSATGYKVKGVQNADLSWSGATTSQVDIYRDGSLIATVSNSGSYTDNIGQKGGGTYVYEVCEAGTSTCSAGATVVF